MCTTVRFDAIFDSEPIFVMDLLPKFVKKQTSSTFGDSTKNFYVRWHKQYN